MTMQKNGTASSSDCPATSSSSPQRDSKSNVKAMKERLMAQMKSDNARHPPSASPAGGVHPLSGDRHAPSHSPSPGPERPHPSPSRPPLPPRPPIPATGSGLPGRTRTSPVRQLSPSQSAETIATTKPGNSVRDIASSLASTLKFALPSQNGGVQAMPRISASLDEHGSILTHDSRSSSTVTGITEGDDTDDDSCSQFSEDTGVQGSIASYSDEEWGDEGDKGRHVSRNASIYGSEAMHQEIMAELQARGKLGKCHRSPPSGARTGEPASGGIPHDVGRIRVPPVKNRSASSPLIESIPPRPPVNNIALRPPSNPDLLQRDSGSFHTYSTISDQSSTGSDLPVSPLPVPAYNTGDPKEDKRLRNLMHAALEMHKVEKTFTELMETLSVSYPSYIEVAGQRIGKDLLAPSNGVPHVIDRIKSHLTLIHNFHSVFLADFEAKISKWDSHNPDIASVLLKNADFLKMCNPFLMEKNQLSNELVKALSESRELAGHTQDFVNQLGHRVPIVQQLDAVHQNVVRYKILAQAYRKYLVDGSHEAELTDKLITKLEGIVQSVNENVNFGEASRKLLEHCRRLQGFRYEGSPFDVFQPGRKLLHEGAVWKQTRKTRQSRYLILFDDVLLICRTTITSDLFDVDRSFAVSVDKMRIRVDDHCDHENEFTIISPKKSATFITTNRGERQQWVTRLTDAHERRRAKRAKPAKTKGTLGGPAPFSNQSTDSNTVALLESPVSDYPPGGNHTLIPVEEKYEALWIADDRATHCLMEGCSSQFTTLRRRHHCRACGWLICDRCSAKAPIKKHNFAVERVCPQCYDDIFQLHAKGQLFPLSRVSTESQVDDARPRQKLKSLDGSKAIDIASMFSAPRGGFRKKMALQAKCRPDVNGQVKSQVLLRSSKSAAEQVKWAVLDGMVLQLYNAEYVCEDDVDARCELKWSCKSRFNICNCEKDELCCERFVIHGFSLQTEELDDGSRLFQLRHRNQFNTGKKGEMSIVFRVVHNASADRWLQALNNVLSPSSE